MQITLNKQLSLFSERLPHKPYCTDNLSEGLSIRPAIKALEKRYIQYNPPCVINWLFFDIDRHFDYELESTWNTITPPNIIVTNPQNGHAHLGYGLVAGVCKTDAARQAPLRLLSAINTGLRHQLDADIGFKELICKNPLHDHWITSIVRENMYDMHELSSWIDLDAAVKHEKSLLKCEQTGLLRNETIFNSLRVWAYKWIADYQKTSVLDHWINIVRDKAEKLNTYDDPLPSSEIKAIAKSVATWTWRKYDGRLQETSLAQYRLTTESFSLLQSNLGKLAMKKRWGDNSGKKADALKMSLENPQLTQKELSLHFGVTQKTISKWLNIGK